MFPYHREQGSAVSAEACAALYLEHRRLLLYLGVRKFGIPEPDAEALVHDVFLSYLQSGETIVNVRSWLVAAACNASRQYLHRRDRAAELARALDIQTIGDLAAEAARGLLVRRLLAVVPPKAREALRLRYLAGCTFAEVGRALDTSERYAQKLVFRALSRIREWYGGEGTP